MQGILDGKFEGKADIDIESLYFRVCETRYIHIGDMKK